MYHMSCLSVHSIMYVSLVLLCLYTLLFAFVYVLVCTECYLCFTGVHVGLLSNVLYGDQQLITDDLP